jgi:hypothetical protein
MELVPLISVLTNGRWLAKRMTAGDSKSVHLAIYRAALTGSEKWSYTRSTYVRTCLIEFSRKLRHR